MKKHLILEKIVNNVKNRLISERKSDEISMKLSRLVIKQFKKNEDFELYDIRFDRGDEYAIFDFKCYFIEDSDLNEPFSIHAEADMEEMEIEISYNPDDFPKNMNDLVAEVKETIEHELEHIEQQNFEDMDVDSDETTFDEEDNYNFKYLTSNVEIPAYVRGLIKRSKTKKISLTDAMDEWFKENKRKFTNPKSDWPRVKKVWMAYAKQMLPQQKIKKFK